MLPVSASLIQVPSGGTSSSSKPWARTSSIGRLVDLDPGQDLLVADAPSRIRVGDVDELADGVLAVAGHAGRHALGDGRDLAADDQAAVVVARDVALDDDDARAALAEGARERGSDRLLGAQVEVDAPPVVAIERLEDAREADPLGRRRPPRPPSRRRRRAAPADRPSRAADWSGSCPTRRRRRWPRSSTSSSPGCAAGGPRGRTGRASGGPGG